MTNTFPKYYIFDLDGMLALSEHVKLAALQEVCSKNHIKQITDKEYSAWAGATLKQIITNFLEKHRLDTSPEFIQKQTHHRTATAVC